SATTERFSAAGAESEFWTPQFAASLGASHNPRRASDRARAKCPGSTSRAYWKVKTMLSVNVDVS
ncbi:MAG: hypothetical protein ACJAQ3_001467, partial [Planctomycetota bacterium]